MSNISRAILHISIASALPSGLAAQMVASAVIEVPPLVVVDRCTTSGGAYQAEWSTILATAAMERDQARDELVALEEGLIVRAEASPTDVELQYVLTAAIGTRAEYEGGRGQVSAAKAAHRQAMTVLGLQPGHPGAQHVIGRLHREVLVMGRIKRFLAIRVLGGGELAGASWESAQALLESAVVGDPCRADHHFALAQLYLDRGEVDQARTRLQYMSGLKARAARDEMLKERAISLLQELAPAS